MADNETARLERRNVFLVIHVRLSRTFKQEYYYDGVFKSRWLVEYRTVNGLRNLAGNHSIASFGRVEI